MKKQSFSLAIGTPCSENWAAMSKTDSGNFCARCEKTVTDFTSLSDEEIIRIIQTKNGKICGRLNPAQLNRSFAVAGQKQSASRFNTLVAGIAALGLAETTALSAQQSNSPAHMAQQVPSAALASALYSSSANASDSSHFMLSGKIVEAGTGGAIPYAIVSLKNSKCSTQADSIGNFSLPIPDSLAADTITLEIKGVGYVNKEVCVVKTAPQLVIPVDQIELIPMMGDIQVMPDNLQQLPVKKKHRKWFR